MVFYMESLKNKRSDNQDSYCHMEIRVNHEAKVQAFCVADGMGGLEAGKEYSGKAVSLWFERLVGVLMGENFANCSLNSQIETLEEFSKGIFSTINERIYEIGMDTGLVGGTTLTTAIHFWDTWIIGNCGDSPLYMMRNGNIELVSQIQNVAWQLVREDKTQIGSTLFYQNKNRLLEYLGKREEVHPYVQTVEEDGIQSILMGSDGAFGDLSMAKIENVLKQFDRKEEALSVILEFAREHGESDNQTAILIYPSNKKHETARKAREDIFLCKEGQDFVLLHPDDTVSFVETEMMEPKYERLQANSRERSLGKRLRTYLSKREKGGL